MSDLSILALQNTTIKRTYQDSSEIKDPRDKFSLETGEKLVINWYRTAPNNHWEFELRSPVGGFYNWYAFKDHVKVQGATPPIEGTPSSQIEAFLEVIAWCEGTDRAIGDGSKTGYNIMYTYKTFTDFSDHPRQINCSGGLCSDAAGRYQFLASTWDMVVDQLSLNPATFEPPNQDKGATQLIKNRGAIADIEAGNVRAACDKLSWEWASLPPGRYGQPIISYEQCEDLFVQAGGVLNA